METQQNVRNVDTTLSYLMLRSILGIIALLLPFLLYFVNGAQLKPSISHFYYSPASVIFTGSLFAFGLFLLSYRGRDDGIRYSDNLITNFAGLMAIVTALIPTAYCITQDCTEYFAHDLAHINENLGITTQWIHNNDCLGTVHLVCAGLFIINMGIMSFFRFTKDLHSKHLYWFYKTCGVVIWLAVAVMIIMMLNDTTYTPYDTFYLESIALLVFGVSWLVKGKPHEILKGMLHKH